MTCARPAYPVVIDLETRSACDIRHEGGFNYAADPTTRLLTVAWTPDLGETYHVWFPGGLGGHHDPAVRRTIEANLEARLKGVVVHEGSPDDPFRPPEALAALADRVWVGHNSWTFDRPVWAALTKPEYHPREWADTYPLALSCGLPGGLDAVGKFLWGSGKYAASKAECKLGMIAKGRDDCDPRVVPAIRRVLIAEYNVQDVRLTADLWKVLQRDVRTTETERKVLAAHDAINTRGVRLDTGLVDALITLANAAKADAVGKIAELSRDEKGKVWLPDEKSLRSRTKVFAWLDSCGVKIGTSLARDVVARFLDEYRDEDDEDYGDPGDNFEDVPHGLPRVLRVLELRSQALRITGGKLEAARGAVCRDGRARGLFAYWAARTGRWAGRKIQVQNLPRPKTGIDVWSLRALYDFTGGLDYDAVRSLMLDRKAREALAANPRDERYRYLTADDAASALLRLILVTDDGAMLAAGDLAQIECRILAWLAGEKWLLKAFWECADPYIATAERIFGPKESWPGYHPKTVKKHDYRQVGKIVELGSGYQLGYTTMGVYAASQGIDLAKVGTNPVQCIIGYRSSHPAIAGEQAGEYEGRPYFKGGYWDRLNEAALRSVRYGETVSVGPVDFAYRDGILRVFLPSGRPITYRNARIEPVDWFGKTIDAVVYDDPRYGRTKMYGGKWCENIVQGTSRDVIAESMVGMEAEGDMPVVLHCHDEAVAAVRPGRFPRFMELLTTPPGWLTDFPLDAEGGLAARYAKTPPPGCTEVTYRNGRPL